MVPDLPSEGALRQLFVVPPFSILDAQQGPWQERKRQWMALGMRSEEGRDAGLVFRHKLIDDLPGTSRFDPVLAECVYRWYAPRPGGGSAPVIVVDPFAGGSVRGIVAAKLGLQYIGIDISATQVDANRAQAECICADCKHAPVWIVGDGEHVREHYRAALGRLGIDPVTPADFLLTCPPYFDLERYDNGPDDLSMLGSYEAFLAKYTRILGNATALLKPQCCAVVVVGNLRGGDGALRDLHGDTKRILAETGNVLYCDAVLKRRLSSAPVRARMTMAAASKLTSVHENVVVVCRQKVLDKAACARLGIAAQEERPEAAPPPPSPPPSTLPPPPTTLPPPPSRWCEKPHRPRVLRIDSRAYDPSVPRVKTCMLEGHEGERTLPLTAKWWYMSPKGNHCKQCKKRYQRAKHHQTASDGAPA